jgi:hypothetical protein
MPRRKRNTQPRKPKREVPSPEYCLGCDLGQHHAGRKVKGCQCWCGTHDGGGDGQGRLSTPRL